MQNNNISVEDLLCDDTFVAYHEGTHPVHKKYWENWMVEHPEFEPVVREALTMLDAMSMHVTDEEIESSKKQLIQAIYQEPKVKKLQRSWWAIGAAAVLCICSFAFYRYLLSTTDKPLLATTNQPSTPSLLSASSENGKRSKLSFADGSTIILIGSSTLRYPAQMTGDSVVVYLDGDAHFDIHHNPERIFIVQTDYAQIAVLGTRFLIEKRQAMQHQVSLIAGKIRLHTTVGQAEQILTSGQRAIVDKNGAMEVSAFNPLQLNDAANNILVFEKASFEEISERLKRYYDVDISLDPHASSNWHFEGRFENMKVEDILEALCFSQQLRYKPTGTQSYIIY